MYLMRYVKWSKPSSTQIIHIEQKEYKTCAGRKESRPHHSKKKSKDHRLAHEKASCILDNFDDLGVLIYNKDKSSEDEMEKYLDDEEPDSTFLTNINNNESYTIIEYESENDFNTGLAEVSLVFIEQS